MSELRMDAYYFSFELTGNPAIDKILSAVAHAGKAFHHTDSWGEDLWTPEGFAGRSCVEWIQNAANDAAKAAAQPDPRDAALDAAEVALRDVAEMTQCSDFRRETHERVIAAIAQVRAAMKGK